MLGVVHGIGSRVYWTQAGEKHDCCFFLKEPLRQNNICNIAFGISSTAIETFISMPEVLR